MQLKISGHSVSNSPVCFATNDLPLVLVKPKIIPIDPKIHMLSSKNRWKIIKSRAFYLTYLRYWPWLSWFVIYTIAFCTRGLPWLQRLGWNANNPYSYIELYYFEISPIILRLFIGNSLVTYQVPMLHESPKEAHAALLHISHFLHDALIFTK